ncbi:hypothetical protein [Agromyces sp. NPDC057865]|uniref:hypothetical protein n=1 Tax=Agromyces sp. NPDC057865 TaxID=3346267 RepID=UPI00366CB549
MTRNALTVVLVSVLTFGGLLVMVELTTPGGLIFDRPDDEIAALADEAFLTAEGREIFFDARPRFRDEDEVSQACDQRASEPDESDGGTTVGCYSGYDVISIFKPDDARLRPMMVTTAAHELLHAVYARLDPAERDEVDALVEAEIVRVPADDVVHGQIAASVGDRSESRANELFAYLGSQVELDGGFAPELEAYYARYFTDRDALVDVFITFESALDGNGVELENDWADTGRS